LAQLDDLGLELRRERPARARLLAFHVSMMDILPGAVPLMVDVRQSRSDPGADPEAEARDDHRYARPSGLASRRYRACLPPLTIGACRHRTSFRSRCLRPLHPWRVA
jgi:hypothetical protein